MAEPGPSPAAARLAEGVVVVLVRPLQPGNVGAAARAMKNMGLDRLVIVDPPAHDPERARWMAPGCDDLLARARVVGTLDEALVGVHRAVATTARHRRSTQAVLEPRQVAGEILDAADDHVTAILFGREDHGLSHAEIERCDAILRVPTPPHASLNLAQAVMVVCHSLFEEARARGAGASGRLLGGSREGRTTRSLERPSPRGRRADVVEMEPAVAELLALLERVGYTRSAVPAKVAVTVREALQAAGPSLREIDVLRGMIARVEWALDHPGLDWRATSKRRE